MAIFQKVHVPNWRLETILRAMSGVMAESVPQKFWHAIIRTRPSVIKALEKFYNKKQEFFRLMVKKDDRGNPILRGNGQPDFETPEIEAQYQELNNGLASELVELDVFQVKFATTFPNENEKSNIGLHITELDFMFSDLYDDVPTVEALRNVDDGQVVEATVVDEAPAKKPRKTNPRPARRRAKKEETEEVTE